MSHICPKGHFSDDADYCSECGARISAQPVSGSGSSALSGSACTAASANSSANSSASSFASSFSSSTTSPGSAPTLPRSNLASSPAGACPDCGTGRSNGARFCEVCRHDFQSGAAFHSGASPAGAAALPGAGSGKVNTSPSNSQNSRLFAPIPAPTRAAASGPDPMLDAFQAAFAASVHNTSPSGNALPSSPATGAAATPVSMPQGQGSSGAPGATPNAMIAAQKLSVRITADPSLVKDVDPDNPFPANPVERIFPLDLAENLVGRRSESKDSHPEIPVNDPGSSRRHLKLLRRADGRFEVVDLNSANGSQLNGKPLEPGVQTLIAPGDEITLGMWTRLSIVSR